MVNPVAVFGCCFFAIERCSGNEGDPARCRAHVLKWSLLQHCEVCDTLIVELSVFERITNRLSHINRVGFGLDREIAGKGFWRHDDALEKEMMCR